MTRRIDRAQDLAGLPALVRSAWVEVDVERLTANGAALARLAHPAALGVVVKADGYGHGAGHVDRAESPRFLEGLEVRGCDLIERRVAGVADVAAESTPLAGFRSALGRRRRLRGRHRQDHGAKEANSERRNNYRVFAHMGG